MLLPLLNIRNSVWWRFKAVWYEDNQQWAFPIAVQKESWFIQLLCGGRKCDSRNLDSMWKSENLLHAWDIHISVTVSPVSKVIELRVTEIITTAQEDIIIINKIIYFLQTIIKVKKITGKTRRSIHKPDTREGQYHVVQACKNVNKRAPGNYSTVKSAIWMWLNFYTVHLC